MGSPGCAALMSDMARNDRKSAFNRPPNPYTTLRAKTISDARKRESLEACRRCADDYYEDDLEDEDRDQEGGGMGDNEAGSGGGER